MKFLKKLHQTTLNKVAIKSCRRPLTGHAKQIIFESILTLGNKFMFRLLETRLPNVIQHDYLVEIWNICIHIKCKTDNTDYLLKRI